MDSRVPATAGLRFQGALGANMSWCQQDLQIKLRAQRSVFWSEAPITRTTSLSASSKVSEITGEKSVYVLLDFLKHSPVFLGRTVSIKSVC